MFGGADACAVVLHDVDVNVLARQPGEQLLDRDCLLAQARRERDGLGRAVWQLVLVCRLLLHGTGKQWVPV